MTANHTRFMLLDIVRGMAVCGMVVFHFVWTLDFFGLSLFTSAFILYLWHSCIPAIGASGFLFISGFSSYLFYNVKNARSRLVKRLLTLGVSASAISIVTFIMFGNNVIYFGIIHLLTLCSLVGAFVRNLPVYQLLGIAILAIIIPFLGIIHLPNIYLFAWIGLSTNPPPALDYYPLFPWVGYYLLGMIFVKQFYLSVIKYQHKQKDASIGFIANSLSFIGRNALVVYLIHQPIFFGLLQIYFLIKPNVV